MKEFKDEFKDLKNITNKIKELELLRGQEINKIKNETKRNLNMLDYEISDILEKLDVNLMTSELRCRFCKNPYDLEEEGELRLSTKEKMNEKEKLKEEVEKNNDELLDHLLDGETKILKY